MAYKCPYCAYMDCLAPLSDGDIVCRQCGLSTSNALLRAQEELVNRFTTYSISHSHTALQTQPAAVKAPVTHIPFASSAAHSIYIPPYRYSPQADTANRPGQGGPETEAKGNGSDQDHFPDSVSESQMDCLPENGITTGFTPANNLATGIPVSTTAAFSHDHDLVEPYMVLGYEEEQRSEKSWQSQEPPQGDMRPSKPAPGPAYATYNDPVFNRQQWWERGDSMMAGLS